MQTVLIFPGHLESSLAFAAEARRWNAKIIGAASVGEHPAAAQYDAWEQLPYIHDNGFKDTLAALIEHHNISAVYTPHAPTYLYLNELLKAFPAVSLMGESPYARQMKHVIAARKKAAAGLTRIAEFGGKAEAITESFLASLFDTATMYGECAPEKILALCAVFTDAPKGDVIEIGTFFGKSVYVLNRLAARFSTGATLAVDAWNVDAAVQHESPLTIQNLPKVWDWEVVFKGFLLALEARSVPPFNYLREISANAYTRYQKDQSVESVEFGVMPMTGSIAVLHLDANHDEASVAEDYRLWGKHVADAGWIIFDDYEWSQGNGARIVADRVIADNQGRIERSFIAGGAMFIKFR